ncbi:CTB family bacteriocin [Phormidesmis priestleyi]
MSENKQPEQAQELSNQELDTVAGGLIQSTRAAFVRTNFEAVGSGAVAAPGFANTDGLAINDETDQAAISQDFVD